MRRHLVATAAAAVGITCGLTACGIQTGEDTFSEIPTEEVPFGLDQASTSTSTTTTSTTIADVPDSTVLATTTTIAPLDQVQIYFLSRGRLQPVPKLLTQDFGPDQVITALEDGPPEEGGAGLETLIEAGLIVSAVVANGIVTIDLDPETFSRIASTDQSEAIGQIVLTLTDNVRRVGGVLFTLGGEPTEVKNGNGLLVGAGEPVTFDDYQELLGSTPIPTTTQPQTTTQPATTTTTVAD